MNIHFLSIDSHSLIGIGHSMTYLGSTFNWGLHWLRLD